MQTFDDDRAAAAMEALVQLSESVQVILLSHHRHLLALARRLPPEQVHVCEIAPESGCLSFANGEQLANAGMHIPRREPLDVHPLPACPTRRQFNHG